MKRKFYRVLAIILTVLSAFSFSACGSASQVTESSTTSETSATPSTSATSAAANKFMDIPYADISDSQKLDIYLPSDGTSPFPVIIAIHGGAFKSGDKTRELGFLQAALDRGYAVVSVNYRLSGEAIFPAAIQDVKAAIRFVKANASDYNLNPDKIAAWGGSAGGNLAALAGTSGDVAALQDDALGNADQSTKIQAVVDWFGPINFLTMDDQFTASGINGQVHNVASSPESVYLGGLITAIPDIVALSNPETYITADDAAFFIQHGTADVLIPTQQSVDFATALTQVLGSNKVYYEALEGAGHGDAMFTTAENIAKALDFLDTQLK